MRKTTTKALTQRTQWKNAKVAEEDEKGAEEKPQRSQRKAAGWYVGTMADGNSPKKQGGSLGDLVKAESMIQLAIALPAGCLVGWLVGAGLDEHFHTNWMAITGIILGAVGGFLQMFLTAARFLKRGGD